MQIIYTENLAEYTDDPQKVFKKNGNLETEFYEKEIYALYHELVKLQQWTINNDKRLLIVFEGMDTGGKSSSIKALSYYWNPREFKSIALGKPNSEEIGQWYFQRHLKHIPNPGEIVCFDRSWYNRAGIEQVFGFCSQEQHDLFYQQVNDVEKMLVDDGVMVFKFYLNISYEVQSKRIKERERNPLKNWKLSSLDYQSHAQYDKYIELRDKMFLNSGTYYAPWIVLDANDKKRARLNLIRFLLNNIDYDGKNSELICGVDKKIVTFFS